MTDCNKRNSRSTFHVLLLYPRIEGMLWAGRGAIHISGRKFSNPPLGLLTVAALLPSDWDVRLIDANVKPLRDSDILWADLIMISSMTVQADAFHKIVNRVRGLGRRIAAGGPYVTAHPELMTGVDHVFVGEAEVTIPAVLDGLRNGTAPQLNVAQQKADITKSPVPRFDLCGPNEYLSITLQFSKGCTFDCEFCEIIQLDGRSPRCKTPEQILIELDAIYKTGFLGSVFFADDNFICMRPQVKKLLIALRKWNLDHGSPFDYATQLSIDLAEDDQLLQALADANFTRAFIGIETPNESALRETGKKHNLRSNLMEAIEKITSKGIIILGGAMIGFDSDPPDIFEIQCSFIQQSPMSSIQAGLLCALPKTRLYSRLEKEGRLKPGQFGIGPGNYYRPNFITKIPERDLIEGFARFMKYINTPRNFFARIIRQMDLMKASGFKSRALLSPSTWWLISTMLRSFLYQGILSSYKKEYWKVVWKIFRNYGSFYAFGLNQVLYYHGFYTNTFNEVLPSLANALKMIDEEDKIKEANAASDPALRYASIKKAD